MIWGWKVILFMTERSIPLAPRRSKANRLKSFRRVNPSITDTFSLSDSFEFDFSQIDLSSAFDNFQSSAQTRFMGRFSKEEIFNVIESIGLLKHLESMGFSDIDIDIDRDVNYINYFKLYWKDKTIENQLIDLRVSEHTFIPHKRFFEEGTRIEPYNMILIEWLSAKNPRAVFDENRPQLPGQTTPGLGILKYCFQLLRDISRQVFKDGFLDIPNHMHGAIMYSKEFQFFDPVQEAILRAAVRDLRRYSLADISWGVITGTIIDYHKGTPAVYDPGEQIHSVSNRLKRYFDSKQYVTTFNRYYNKKRYYFKYDEMVRKRKRILSTKKLEDL